MQDPSYRHMGDHTETVQVDYDPERISYGDLLKIFWETHDPQKQAWSQQYMNAVFYHTDAQQKEAEVTKSILEKKLGKPVQTDVVPVVSFTPAEDYHQKYLLKGNALKSEITRSYPRHQELINSTAAARLNGYIGGYGSKDQLERELNDLGLSDKDKETLRRTVERKGGFLN